VTLGVYNEAGELVDQIKVVNAASAVEVLTLSTQVINGLDQPVTLSDNGGTLGTWNGAGQDGQPVSNGQYYVKAESVDSSGVVISVTQPILVQRSLSHWTLDIYNESGEVVRHLLNATTDPQAGVVHSLSLSTSVFSLPQTVDILGDGKVLADWDGSTDSGNFVSDGTYFVTAHEWNGMGEESNITVSLAVLGAAPDAPVRAWPNFIQGTGGTVLKVAASPALTLSATFYDLAAEKVGFEQGPSGANEVLWQPRGLASGLYVAVVECRNSGGQLTSRQEIRIAVIR
jgi:flagellar hook assembly protein FlgD